jgi:hypothetical protein
MSAGESVYVALPKDAYAYSSHVKVYADYSAAQAYRKDLAQIHDDVELIVINVDKGTDSVYIVLVEDDDYGGVIDEGRVYTDEMEASMAATALAEEEGWGTMTIHRVIVNDASMEQD